MIYIFTLSWCYGSMSSVLCESYTVQNEPGYSQSYAIRRKAHIHSQV